MLAPSQLPERFKKWNELHGAPFGHHNAGRRFFRRFYSETDWQKARGPFSIQANSTTRTYEYPWAYYAADLSKPRKVAEIGGSLSGFQFVLSKEGHEVVNVDPGMEAAGLGWPSDAESIRKLNSWFNTNVQFMQCTIGKANLSSSHYDIIYSISVLEHLPEADIQEVMEHAYRCLKPKGLFVITLDLFINLEPFTKRKTNEWGQNQNVRSMVEMSRMRLVQGEPSQLLGYPQFDPENILSNLETFMIGNYPVLTQAIVLQKP